MITAFGTALLDSIAGPMRSYTIAKDGERALHLTCEEYITLRTDEEAVLQSLRLPARPRVLDVGCGTGRHLAFLRSLHENLESCGIEHCDRLRQHCTDTSLTSDHFLPTLAHLPPEASFDLILLLGNGLGILGPETDAFPALHSLLTRLSPGGRLLLETGTFWNQGYSAPLFTIRYNGLQDGPFPWGFASRDWVQDTAAHCDLAFHPSSAQGPIFFFAELTPRHHHA